MTDNHNHLFDRTFVTSASPPKASDPLTIDQLCAATEKVRATRPKPIRIVWDGVLHGEECDGLLRLSRAAYDALRKLATGDAAATELPLHGFPVVVDPNYPKLFPEEQFGMNWRDLLAEKWGQ